MRNISIIAAIDIRGGFAKNNEIPWITEPVGKIDLKHFRDTTAHHNCIMGVNTYNEIYNIQKARLNEAEVLELLPNRKCYVVSSKPDRECPGATVVSSLRVARQLNDYGEELPGPLFVIGGRRLFIEALTWADDLYLTIINKDYDCDAFLPLKYITKMFAVAEIDKQDGLTFVHYVRQEPYKI